MKIRVATDLNRIDYIAQGPEVPKIAQDSTESELLIQSYNNPVLLVDNARNGQLPSLKRDLLARLLEFPERTFEYDDVAVQWSEMKYPGVWSPSIDTILFANGLKQVLGQPTTVFRSFLEIGCGSGFLSKYILELANRSGQNIEYAQLMDINPDALRCAKDNIGNLAENTKTDFTLNVPNAPLAVATAFDLVICNPPYVLRPNSNDNNPFEGLFLYGEILGKAKSLLKPNGQLIINFSSISKDMVYPEYEKVFDMKKLNQLKVPLKIPVITAGLSQASREWLAYLENNNRLTIDPKEQSGYRYWHTIEIVECKIK